MLKKATLLVTALTLSACGAKDLPGPSLGQGEAAVHSSAKGQSIDEATLIGSSDSAETLGASENAELQGPGEEAQTIANGEAVDTLGAPETNAEALHTAESVAVASAPDASYTLPPTEKACPTINGSFVLTIGGEIRDRITIQTKRENGKLAYSFNNGSFYETENKVHTNSQGGLARVSCDRELVRLNYRDSSGGRHGRLEIVALSDSQLKVTNDDSRIALSGMYVSAQ